MRIGVDIVDIDRMEVVAKRTPHFLSRVFSAGELEYCLSKRNPYPSLAARFAAKEAFRKIDVSLCQGIRFSDVEVAINCGGRPELILSALVLAKTRDLGISHWDISLSHSHNQAMAAVIVYGE